MSDKPATSDVTFASVINTYAERNNIDVTRAGKAIRSRLRAMGDDTLRESWPAFKSSGKAVRDGNRYPSAMPRDLAVTLLMPRRAVERDTSTIEVEEPAATK